MPNDLEKIFFKTTDADIEKKIADLKTEWSFAEFLKKQSNVVDTVRSIVADVGDGGDVAVAEYTNKFDNVNFTPTDFRVSEKDLKTAFDDLDKNLLASLRRSIDNVRKYQTEICITSKPATSGIKYAPVKRAAMCIPGASAPLPSTVIMTAVPAQVAGVEEIVVLSPPRHDENINPVILGLCYELGIKEVYRISGAQAVAAAAWGTKTIKKVDMIVGPGNNYVQMAKKEVFGLVKIDSFAGPSDVVIIANDAANPSYLAADMLSQAEHAPGAALLITDSKGIAQKTLEELEAQLKQLSRADETRACLLDSSAIILTKDLNEAIDFANEFAAEHLEIQCGKKSSDVEKKIENAGAIFIGENTPVAVGDYFAGPSHTLPTRCTTKFFSALTANDFLKSSSLIQYTADKLKDAADDIIRIATVEGLDAHAKSVQKRIENE